MAITRTAPLFGATCKRGNGKRGQAVKPQIRTDGSPQASGSGSKLAVLYLSRDAAEVPRPDFDRSLKSGCSPSCAA